MTNCSFAVIPDETREPAAVFLDLEEAIDWALKKYGGDRFAIRRVDYVEGGHNAN